jgi:hypothetical protein
VVGFWKRRLCLKSEGHSNREIAKLIGVGETTVRRDAAPNGAPQDEKPSKSKTAPNGHAPNGANQTVSWRPIWIGRKQKPHRELPGGVACADGWFKARRKPRCRAKDPREELGAVLNGTGRSNLVILRQLFAMLRQIGRPRARCRPATDKETPRRGGVTGQVPLHESSRLASRIKAYADRAISASVSRPALRSLMANCS